jgi:hypothetical protein
MILVLNFDIHAFIGFPVGSLVFLFLCHAGRPEPDVNFSEYPAERFDHTSLIVSSSYSWCNVL